MKVYHLCCTLDVLDMAADETGLLLVVGSRHDDCGRVD